MVSAAQHQKQPKFHFKCQNYSAKTVSSWTHIEEDSNLVEISDFHLMTQTLDQIFHLETLSS